ncbi:MAG: aminopeptidase, partial [Rubrobacter sp.]
MRSRNGMLAALALALLVALLAVGAVSAAPGDQVQKALQTSAELRRAVDPNGILIHERRFQRIANDSKVGTGGEATRASGTRGYRASANYVAGKLRAAGYSVRQQSFQFPFFVERQPAELEQVSPTATTYETGTFTYSGNGDVTGQLVPTNDVVL